MKSCLNCRWQPEWEELKQRGGYSIRMGDCRFPIPNVKLPACITSYVSLKKRRIQRYSDDSGVYHCCQTWEAPQENKEEKQANAQQANYEICPRCGGAGQVYMCAEDGDGRPCPRCGGSGKLS